MEHSTKGCDDKMTLISNEYRDRFQWWKKALEKDFYQPLKDLCFEGFTTMDYLTPQQAQEQEFSPVPEDFVWGHSWEYLWLRASFVIPPEADGQRVVMNLDLSGEASLFVNGSAFGTRRAEWVTIPHHYLVDNTLTDAAVPGEKFELLFEVYAGHDYPGDGSCATGPVFPGGGFSQKPEGSRAVLGHSTIGLWNEDAYQLWLDVTTLNMLMEELAPESLRAAKIAEGLEAFTRLVDFEQNRDQRISDYRAARKMLKPLLEAKNGTTMPVFSAIGNAHLDLAWLWPWQETCRKTERTFAQQLRLLERYPQYRFIQSQPAAYEMCRDHYPELYKRILSAIHEGRWIAEGAMYVEPDTNMPSGESLIRQVVFGKRFYSDEFGIDSQILWLPDTFGYSAVLPQILKKCHVNYLVTQKIFWSYNDGDRFPYHYFTWQGMDGSTVTSFLPTSYTYRTDPKQIAQVWKSRVQLRDLDEFLLPFGYGDGGGGPCRDHVEYALRQQDLEGSPHIKIESPVDFFHRMDEKGGPKNRWVGELYFNAHRGTYTTQAKIKRNNRLSETALHDLELWGTVAMLRGKEYPSATVEMLWKKLLLNQFHDILPGSSIARVYEEANAVHEELQRRAHELTVQARRELIKNQEGLVIFNSLGFERTEVVDLPGEFSEGAATLEGTPVPVMNGKGIVKVPPLGCVTLIPKGSRAGSECAHASLVSTGAILENGLVRVRLNQLGEIVSYLTADRREYATGPMNCLQMYKDVPRKFDAWDIDSNYCEQQVVLPGEAEMELLCSDGIEVAVRVVRKLGKSSITQKISLTALERTVRFDTEVEWRELHRLLKVAFATDILADNALHEMQFGYVERPTHRNRACDKDRFEVCNHRYTVLADGGHGCAVMNDCKYGVSVEGSTIFLTLLRAAASPEMAADNGYHHFTYAFETWEGPFAQSRVVQDGLRLNVPLGFEKGATPAFSLFSVDKNNVIIDMVKPADDGSGDLILRIYESQKCDTWFTLCTKLGVERACLCDMLECPESELDVRKPFALHIHPFEVLTIRFHLLKQGKD